MSRRTVALLLMLGAGEVSAGVGRYSSVAVGTDGLGLISYRDSTNTTLKVAHCVNLACSSATLTSIESGGLTTSVAIGSDGLGLVSHVVGTFVRMAHCSNLECTSATTATVFDAGFRGAVGNTSLVIADNAMGLLTFNHRPDPRLGGIPSLYLSSCTDLPCTAAAHSVVAVGHPIFGGPQSGGPTIGPDGGALIPFAQYIEFPTFAYQVFVTSSSVPIGNGNRAWKAAFGPDGRALIPWTSDGAGLRLARCADIACSTSSTAVPDLSAGIEQAVAAPGRDGLGLIAYVVNDDLKVAHCSDPACSSATLTVLDSVAIVDDAHLAIGADGLGLISYNDRGSGDLKVAHCENVLCTSATISVVDDGVGLSADLAVSVSHSPEPVVGLQTLSYDIAYINRGPDSVSGVIVTQSLPAGVVFQSAGGTGWSCAASAGVVTCSRPDDITTPPNITVTVTAPPTAQVLSSTVTVSSSAADGQPADNTDTELATVTPAPQSDLGITKGDFGAVGRWGQPFSWTITASNAGPNSVTGARVTDTFPPGVADVVWTCTASPTATCPPGGAGNLDALVDLGVGGSVTIIANGNIDPFTFGLTNSATISPPAGLYDPSPADNTATVISPLEPTLAFPVAPCRVVDTRITPPALDANTTREFTVAGTCGVPADARAVAVIVTAVNPEDVGNLRLYPTGSPLPLSSVLNFAAGRTRANNAIIPLGQGGQISVRCDMMPGSTGATHFVLDVFSYFK